MAGTIHVIGAGLAGLAAAVAAAKAGRRVAVHESAGHAGGRCRSLFDESLGRTIDNGNHLVLSGNRAIGAYLAEIGSADAFVGPARAEFPFLDLGSGERWRLRPGGPLPWWIFSPARRVPGTRSWDYLGAVKLLRARPDATVTDCLEGRTVLFRRLWEPLAVAILNARPEEASAALLGKVLAEIFGQGEAACRPLIAREGLGPALVEPGIAHLRAKGVAVGFNRRLRAVGLAGEAAGRLDFGRDQIVLAAEDRVILAVPPAPAAALLPGLVVPEASRAILNAHFVVEAAAEGPATLLGLVGGLAQWIFRRGDIASVTVSAADAVIDAPADDLAARLWAEVAQALGLSSPLPPHRIVKERRATFAQTPGEVARRPATRTRWRNVFLAGDWTATDLPATIEGAIRSGNAAAAAALS